MSIFVFSELFGEPMTDTPKIDKRSGKDRRVLDIGPPPGVAERRLRPERRGPHVEEVEFDEHIEVLPVAGGCCERDGA